MFAELEWLQAPSAFLCFHREPSAWKMPLFILHYLIIFSFFFFKFSPVYLLQEVPLINFFSWSFQASIQDRFDFHVVYWSNLVSSVPMCVSMCMCVCMCAPTCVCMCVCLSLSRCPVLSVQGSLLLFPPVHKSHHCDRQPGQSIFWLFYLKLICSSPLRLCDLRQAN